MINRPKRSYLTLLVFGCISWIDGPVLAQATFEAASIPLHDPRPDYHQYQQQGAYDQFSWDLFLYINWPALKGVRGVPDPEKSLKDSAGTTWETWKDIEETMPENGSRPQPWNETAPTDSSELFTFLESHGFYDSERVPQVDGHRLKDSYGKPTYMGLRSNQSTFEYLVDRTLYSEEGQIAFFNDPAASPIDFPTSAMQIKSSWILLSDERFAQEKDQYHTVTLTYPKDNSTLHFALIGLHIMSKVQPNWFWTTFEHVRSNEVTSAGMTVPISDSTQQVNDEMKARLEGTPWSYYQCRGSQWSFLNGEDEPVLLSNTTIETRVQSTSSCMTCHSLASRGSRAVNHLPMFRKSSSGLEGYVGTPFWLQYCQDGTPTTQGDGTSRGEMLCSDVGLDYKYRAMDFVWIIRLAN